MTQKPSRSRKFVDPIQKFDAFNDVESTVAIAGHPLHAMMVAFPITLAFCTFAADGLYWWTGDAFWPRVALWSAGVGFVIGVLAGVVGTVELLAVRGIRVRSASWTHFILAVMLLSLLGANWVIRQGDAEAIVLPWGMLVSAICAGMTAITGWHGGKLVFDYQIGTKDDHRDPP
ncbi:MAG: DUF2231 domain-containing protein [Pseudotabrizicola sp.]|uniref:DUF2231 domain-containing protein n=1 Tax=Pseudotabrizicola sp. TaxID=2939647 RepID=UPI002721F046|nr:DUF2231 domain-containing protein [Pseudotabrizicola sp.]MDO9639910.1 DUF2231 domain-containing protein [Pseudotabrizicola sp.]